MKKEGAIVLTCGADDKFSMPLAVTLYSALVNLNKSTPAIVYILDSGISEINKEKISKTLKGAKDNFELNFIKFDISKMPGLVETDVISKATYLRILIPSLLPQNISATIYLDADLIIERDLTDLWDIPFEGKAVIGVQDYCFPYVSSTMDHVTLNVPKESPYCNAGVIYMNIDKWRELDLPSKIFEFIQSSGKHDQDGINAIIGGNWKLADPRWNVTLSSIGEYEKNYKLPAKQLLNEPYIIHYTSRYKPWHSGYGNKEALNQFYYQQREIGRFFYYLEKSGWYSKPYITFWKLWRKSLLAQYKLRRKLGA